MMYGDKETFWLSWELAEDLDYAFYDGMAGSMGVLRDPRDVDDMDLEEDDEDEDEWEYEDEDSFEEEEEVEDPKAEITGRRPSDLVASSRTICSPQLLHFNRAGKPMWFNGWVATKKFDSLKFRPFDVYMREPWGKRPKEGRPAWELKGNNIVCLTSEEYFDFTAEEQAVLNGLLDSAERNYLEKVD